MNFIKKTLLCILCAVLCLTWTASASGFEIKDFGIKSIDIPDDFMACSRDKCDDELLKLLEGNRYTFADWISGVMEPGGFYVYACNKSKLSDCIYLVCKEVSSPRTADGQVSHRLAADYNMLDEADDRNKLTENKGAGAKWLTDTAATPYIEYTSLIGDDYCHCYETIYMGRLITLQFSSKKDFTSAQKNSHRAILDSLTYTEAADYTELKALVEEHLQQKLAEETHSGENTRIIRIMLSTSLAFVIGFSIYLAIRSQNKKRRKTIVLREAEVIQEETNQN